MGYTQYYHQKRDFTDNEWKKICDAFDFIYIDGVDANILAPYAAESFEECESGGYVHIHFEGVGDDAHETFLLGQTMTINSADIGVKIQYNTCKTARKPYDKYVTAILSIADYYAPGALKIKSDGYSICVDCRNTKTTCNKVADNSGFGCWLPGILLATEVCGITHMPKGLEMEVPVLFG